MSGARAWDGQAYAAWSAGCLFFVDTTKPRTPTITMETAGPYALNKAVAVGMTNACQ
jgi:hypothetical protein